MRLICIQSRDVFFTNVVRSTAMVACTSLGPAPTTTKPTKRKHNAMTLVLLGAGPTRCEVREPTALVRTASVKKVSLMYCD